MKRENFQKNIFTFLHIFSNPENTFDSRILVIFLSFFSEFGIGPEMDLYASLEYENGPVRKLRISAFERYQNCENRIRINPFPDRFQILKNWPKSQKITKMHESNIFSGIENILANPIFFFLKVFLILLSFFIIKYNK